MSTSSAYLGTHSLLADFVTNGGLYLHLAPYAKPATNGWYQVAIPTSLFPFDSFSSLMIEPLNNPTPLGKVGFDQIYLEWRLHTFSIIGYHKFNHQIFLRKEIIDLRNIIG